MTDEMKKSNKSIIIKGGHAPPTMFERQALIKLISEIAKRISRDKQDDVAKSA